MTRDEIRQRSIDMQRVWEKVESKIRELRKSKMPLSTRLFNMPPVPGDDYQFRHLTFRALKLVIGDVVGQRETRLRSRITNFSFRLEEDKRQYARLFSRVDEKKLLSMIAGRDPAAPLHINTVRAAQRRLAEWIADLDVFSSLTFYLTERDVDAEEALSDLFGGLLEPMRAIEAVFKERRREIYALADELHAMRVERRMRRLAEEEPLKRARRAVRMADRRVEANRRNAQLSTGPRSEEGKRKARMNAFKHGVAAQIVPGTPEAEIFDEIVATIVADHANPLVLQEAREIAQCTVILDRIASVRARMSTGAPLPKLLGSPVSQTVAVVGTAVDCLRLTAQTRAALVRTRAGGEGEASVPLRSALSTIGPEPEASALERAADEMLKLDRYERRALSRRRSSVRRLDAMLNTASNGDAGSLIQALAMADSRVAGSVDSDCQLSPA